jgi:uncharacterized coiled-coil DUF342 family protein
MIMDLREALSQYPSMPEMAAQIDQLQAENASLRDDLSEAKRTLQELQQVASPSELIEKITELQRNVQALQQAVLS